MEQNALRLTVLRGGNPDNQIGNTDSRIYDYLDKSEFQTTIFIAGRPGMNESNEIHDRISKRISIPIPKGFLGSIVGNVRAFREVMKTHPDMIIVNPGYILAAMLFWVLGKRKLIVDIRSVPVEIKGLSGIIKETLFFGMMNIPICSGATFITEGTRECVNRRVPYITRIPYTIWESGVEENEIGGNSQNRIKIRNGFGIEEKTKVMVYEGTLAENRGIKESVQAISLLPANDRMHLKFILIGGGAAESNLKKMVVALRLEEIVQFIGPIPHKDVIEILHASDIGICPLPDIQWYRISSPLKIYEYAAAELLIVATDIEAHNVIKDCAIFTTNESPIELAKGISRAMNMTKDEADLLRDRAMALAKRSTWRKRAETLTMFLRNMI